MSYVPVEECSAKQLLKEASQLATLIKACLVRSVFPSNIAMGHDKDGVPYTPDFSDARNRAYFDHRFMPRAQEIVAEAQKRGMDTVMTQMFTPQGMLAIELGNTGMSFKELTEHIYPQEADKTSKNEALNAGPASGAIIFTFPSLRHG